LAEVRDHEDGRPAYPFVAGQRAAFFRGTYARKARKVRKGLSLMTLSIFPTFLAFLTQKLRWIRANQKTLVEIRREAVGRRLAAEQTRSLLDGLVRAGWLRLVTTKTAAALSMVRQPAALFRVTSASKIRKVRKGCLS
jgi:hypothetical protein